MTTYPGHEPVVPLPVKGGKTIIGVQPGETMPDNWVPVQPTPEDRARAFRKLARDAYAEEKRLRAIGWDRAASKKRRVGNVWAYRATQYDALAEIRAAEARGEEPPEPVLPPKPPGCC